MDSFGQLDFTGTVGAGGALDLSTRGALVRFFTRPELVPFKSDLEGTSIYRQAEYVQVSFPGEHDEIYREATAADKKRWPRQYQAYKDGKEDIADGTPILVLFPANPEIAEALKASKVHTVEQLAEMSDTALQNLPMGGNEWAAKAKRFLTMTRTAGRLAQIEKNQSDLAEKNENLRGDNETLKARIAELEAAAKKKRGHAAAVDADAD